MGNYDFDLDLQTNNTMSVINDWLKDNSRILEFGPANGRLTRYLANERNCRMTIVEIDEESGSEAAEFAEKSFVGLEQGDIGKLYWADGSKYDFIIFADVLEHLSNPKLVLQTCKKMLSEDGKILVSIPNLAHNSVLINLMNDQFEYDKAGLLDNTHIHFFTYNSFRKMIDECELHIDVETPIYSRVGNNEIDSRYSDVPVEVEEYLRQRTTGAIYQFVYCISNNSEGETKSDVKRLDIEATEELEASLFYKESVNDTFSDEMRISFMYGKTGKTIFESQVNSLAEGVSLRLDPMECSGTVYLESALLIYGDKTVSLEMKESNAVGVSGKVYLFESEDPWITFQVQENIAEGAKIIFVYEVLDYKLSLEFKNKLKCYLDNMAVNVKRALLEDENEKRRRELVEAREYIDHLEKDVVSLNGSIAEQQEFVNHLQKDIEEQRVCIEAKNQRIAELEELKGLGIVKVAIRRLLKK